MPDCGQRLEAALDYARKRSQERMDERRKTQSARMTTQKASEISSAYWESVERADPTRTARIRASALDAAALAWPDRRTRIDAISKAIEDAAKKVINTKTECSKLISPNEIKGNGLLYITQC